MYSLNMSLMSFFVVLLAVAFVEAQDIPPCASSLLPCAKFLNSTNPPESCCQPLLLAVKTQRKCLCDLYNTPGLLQGFGVDKTQAIALINHCGYKAREGSICGQDPSTAPAPTTGSPTASPAPHGAVMSPSPAGGSEDEHHSGSTSNVAWTGITTFLLISAALMLH